MSASPFREIEQRHLYAVGQRGDCNAACVASIFGLELDELASQGVGPGCGFHEISRWTSECFAGIEYREQDFTRNTRLVEGNGDGGDRDRWEYDLPPADHHCSPPTYGLWIAHVISPRGLMLDGPYRGMPIWHSVVMCAGVLRWDPHPQRDMGIGQTVGMGWWVMREPGFAWRRDFEDDAKGTI